MEGKGKKQKTCVLCSREVDLPGSSVCSACRDLALSESTLELAERETVPSASLPAPDSPSSSDATTIPSKDTPKKSLTTVLPKSPDHDDRDQVIGPYRLKRLLAKGGMGEVFVAEQSEPVQRLVALKIVKLGLDSREVLRRFEAERQALAILDHPCITRVFDAGTAPSGRPYFVMELVDGIPITEYADKNRYSAKQRLELFVKVCDAVNHAHQKGIIHRDLKPSNILVEEVSGIATPKIIDFGIAKAMGTELTERTLETQWGDLLGTPQYMSPEQALGKVSKVDTRTDVYSLGVILYELLTGTLPLSSEAIYEAGILGVGKLLMEHEPERPSTRLLSIGEEATHYAQARGTNPATLRRSLQKELDWVALKCLEKEPERRYDSASELARDLDRHLNNQFVKARPPDLPYRIRKYVSRHKLELIAVSVVILTLMLGIVASMMFAFQAYEQREEAELAQAKERLGRESMAALNLARTAPSDALRKLYHVDERGIAQGLIAEWNTLTNHEDLSASIQSSLAQTLELARERKRLTISGTARPSNLAVDSSGEHVAVSYGNIHGAHATSIWVADLATGEERILDTSFSEVCRSLTFLGNGTHLAAAFDSGIVSLIPLDGSLPSSFDSHPGSNNSGMAHATKAGLLVTFGNDGYCRRWTEDGKAFGFPARIEELNFDEIAVTSDGSMAVLRTTGISTEPHLVTIRWDGEAPPVINRIDIGKPAASSVLISEEGLIVTGHINGSVEIRDFSGDVARLPIAAHQLPIESMTLLPGGDLLATGVNASRGHSVETVISIWNLDTGKKASSDLIGHSETICGLDMAMGGIYLASVSTDKTFRLWNLMGLQSAPPIGVEVATEAMDFHPDGSTLLTLRSDCSLELWDWKKRKKLASTPPVGKNKPISVKISPSGKIAFAQLQRNQEVPLFLLPDLSPGPAISIPKGSVIGACFHPVYDRLFLATPDGSIYVADEASDWKPTLINQLPIQSHSAANSHIAWLETQDALLVSGNSIPPTMISSNGKVLDRLRFSNSGLSQSAITWDDLETNLSWFVSTIGSGEMRMIPIQDRKFGTQITLDVFPMMIQGEDMTFSGPSQRIGVGTVNGLFAITDERLNVIVPAFYPHDSRFEAVASHPSLPIIATSGRDDAIRFWAAGQDAFLQLAESRQSAELSPESEAVLIERPKRVSQTAKGVTFDSAGVTIPAHVDWVPVPPALVEGTYESLMRLVGDGFRRAMPHGAWFSSDESKEDHVTGRDFVIFAEISEGSYPEALAERVGFYYNMTINRWSDALEPTVIFDKQSPQLNWDEEAAICTFEGEVRSNRSDVYAMHIHWIVADGSAVAVAAFSAKDGLRSKEFLSQVEQVAYSATVREENRLSSERLEGLRAIMETQWETIKKSSGRKDPFDQTRSRWLESNSTPDGLAFARTALQIANDELEVHQGLWNENHFRRRAILAKTMVGHSVGISRDPDKGREHFAQAINDSRQLLETNYQPQNHSALAQTLVEYRRYLAAIKAPKRELLEVQLEVIDTLADSTKSSARPDLLARLASAHREAANLARMARNFTEAEAHCQKAEKIYLEEINPISKPTLKKWKELRDVYNVWCDTMRDNKDVEGSIAMALRALEASHRNLRIHPSQVHANELVSLQHWKLGSVYRQDNNFKLDQRSRTELEKSLAILRRLEAENKISPSGASNLKQRTIQFEEWSNQPAKPEG